MNANPSDFPVVKVQMTDAEVDEARAEKLQLFGVTLAKKRDEWVAARQSSGVDQRMREDADQYHGRDAANKLVSSMMTNVEAGYPISSQASKPTRSTLFVGVTRQKTNAGEARLADIVLPTDDRNFGVDPTPVPELAKAMQDPKVALDSNGQPMLDPKTGQPLKMSDVAMAVQLMAEKTALAMQDEIDDQLSECDYNGEVRKVIHDAALYGTGVLKGPVVVSRTRKAWRTQTDSSGAKVRTLEVVEELGPASFRVDVRNCFPDPACGDNIHNGSGHFEYEALTARRVRELAKQPNYLESQIKEVLKSKPKVGSAADSLRDTAKRDLASTELYDKWEYWGEIDNEDLAAAGVDIDPEDTLTSHSAVVEMIGDVVVRAYLNPLEDGALPYDYMPWEKVADSPFGYGVPYLMRAQQQVTNAAWRQMMDNAGITSGPQIIVKPGQIQPADKRWELSNRKIWFATDDTQDVRSAFTTVQFDSRQGELANILAMSEKISDQETAVPMMMQGEKGSAPETVGGMQMLMNNSNVVLRRLVKQFDDFITKPHIRRYYDYNMMYSDKEEIKGDFNVVARGSSALMIRDIQNQTFVHLMALAANPVFAPMIDPKKLFEKALRAQHVDPAGIMRTDEEIKRNMEMAAQNQKPDPRVQAATVRANADMQRTQAQAQESQAELQMKQQAAREQREFELQRLYVERDIAMARLAADQNISLDKVKASLADTALRERTKKELFTAEAQIKASVGTGL